MSSPSALAHRPELDEFLFAAIGEERNGMSLTVASALGRLGLDPWTEADRFSAMSRSAAAQKLAPLIARLPEGLWAPADALAIASRLVNLLPAASAASTVVAGGRKRLPIVPLVLIAALLVTVVLAMAAGRDLSPGRLFAPAALVGFSADDPKPNER